MSTVPTSDIKPAVTLEQLMCYYAVDNIDDLIKEQADHVNQLQNTLNKLRPVEVAFVRAPREG